MSSLNKTFTKNSFFMKEDSWNKKTFSYPTVCDENIDFERDYTVLHRLRCLLGLKPRKDPNEGEHISLCFGKRFQWRRIFVIIYLHLSMARAFNQIIFLWLQDDGLGFWESITDTFHSLSAAITVDILVYKEQEIVNLITFFEQKIVPLLNYSLRRIVQKTLRPTKYAYTCCLIVLLACLWLNVFYVWKFPRILQYNYFGFSSLSFPIWLSYGLIAIERGLFVVVTWGVLAGIMAFYVSLCTLMGLALSCWNKKADYSCRMFSGKPKKEKHFRERIMTLRKEHCNFGNAVLLVESLFSPLVFVWCSHFLLVSLNEITYRIAFSRLAVSFILPLGMAAVLNSLPVVTFFLMTLTAATTSDLSEESLQQIRMLFTRSLQTMDLCTDLKMKSLTLELMNSKIAFTAWNFFTLDRSLILTIAGALLTYGVVVAQFKGM
ncbi:uncharacterized protein LOC143246090 [Tachypleus tridentatus]|uniref:uncharacterized protein LOC143246090 n=1 Tax=Tachypleus tridentatus TaxID=6853 RepID=UPI003FD3C5E6